MARVRSEGNLTTERRLVILLRQQRVSGWRRHFPLPGHPDFAWPKERVVVFVDGCFWHGHKCDRNLIPRTNLLLWQKKIANTKLRDKKANGTLRKLKWKVVRVWECRLAKDPARCLRRIQKTLEFQRRKSIESQ
jgi:DNA mismatch endonuclease, patch repair protein